MKFLKKDDVGELLSSNMNHKMKMLLVLSHREVENLKESRELAKDLLDSNMNLKTIQRYMKLLFKYESKLLKELEDYTVNEISNSKH